MKKFIIGGLAVIVVVLVVLVLVIKKPSNSVPIVQDSIVGCYAMNSNKDVYTLNVISQEGKNVTGTLAFKNFEKDSSRGTFTGTYNNGILLGKHAFTSEGMDSVMEVAFKKVGDYFVRGYGPVSNEGTQFANPTTIKYDETLPLSVFKKTACLQ